jgi:hypothetical protein
MRKIDLILENIRDEYMINLLEEGSVSELETLKTKKFLNENLNRIRGMLIQEGALDSVKQHLGNNWGKYLAGAGALGAGAAANHYLGQEVPEVDPAAAGTPSTAEDAQFETNLTPEETEASNFKSSLIGMSPEEKAQAIAAREDNIDYGYGSEVAANNQPDINVEEFKDQTANGRIGMNPAQVAMDMASKNPAAAAAGAAGLGAAGYGAKKAYDRFTK